MVTKSDALTLDMYRLVMYATEPNQDYLLQCIKVI